MEKYKFINLAIFIIFFGTALFEAFQKQHWVEVAFFWLWACCRFGPILKEKLEIVLCTEAVE